MRGYLSIFLLSTWALAAASPSPEDEPLPTGAVARLGTLRFRQGGWVAGVHLSHDGRRLASTGQGYVRVWDAATGKQVFAWQWEPRGPRDSVALSPDGRTVAVGGSDVRLFDVDIGKEVKRIDASAQSLAYAPDGKTIATVAPEKGATLWDVTTGKSFARLELRELPDRRQVPVAVTFSRDGTRVAWIEGARVGVRDLRSGKDTTHVIADKLDFFAVALSADGTRLATACDDRAVKVWDVESNKLLHTFAGHAATPLYLAFSPDRKLIASGSGDPKHGSGYEPHALRLWDVTTGKEVTKFGTHSWGAGASGVSFSPDGKRVYCGGDMSVRAWDLTTRKEVLYGAGHQGWVGALAYSPDGATLASAGSDQTVRLWDVKARKERQVLEGCDKAIDSVAFAPDGTRLAAGTRGGKVVIWELPGGKEVVRLQACKDGWDVRAAFSPDGTLLATVSRRGQVGVWDTATWKEVRRLPQSEMGVVSLAFLPDSKRLVLGHSGEMGRKVRGEKSTEQIQLWDVTTGTEVRRFAGSGRLFVTSVQVSPDGRWIAAGSWDSTIEMWDALTGTLRWRATAKSGGNRLAFTPDGRMLASTGYGSEVSLWEVASGKERRRWAGHFGLNCAIAVATDGRTVASGGMDTAVLLWDVRATPTRAGSPAEHWRALADNDAKKAYEAILGLTANPQLSVEYLRGQLRPAAGKGMKVERLLADLDSDDFATREKATQALIELGAVAEPALRQASEKGASLEVRRRVERILRGVVARQETAEELRQLRAVEGLEYCAKPEARKLLQALSRGADEARLTREARVALDRLTRRTGSR